MARHSQGEGSDESQEEYGRMLVHGHVMRPLTNQMLLSITLGNGAQIVCMFATTLFLACLGLLTPGPCGCMYRV